MKDALQNRQPGAHLDADQLSAFAEGVLPEHERLLVLRHTAECARCREVAFLAQEPVPVEAHAGERLPWWRALLNGGPQPWMLGGAAALVASVLVVGVFVRNRPQPVATGNVTTALGKVPEPIPEQPAQGTAAGNKAMMDAPPPPAAQPAPLPSVASHVSAGAQPPGVEPQAARPVAVPAPPSVASAMATASAPSPATPPAVMAKAAAQPQAARAGMLDKSALAMAAPLPPRVAAANGAGAASPTLAADASAAAIQNAQVQQLPLYARNQAPLRAAKARAREEANGPLRLQIEHGAGPDDGSARLSGVVLDPSGATIPGAVVRLSQPASGLGTQATADAAGRFTLPPVPAGRYQAQVTAPGFTSLAQPIDLLSRDVARADAVLAVGAVSEAVEVSADNAMVTSAEVSTSRVLGSGDALPSGLPAATVVSSGNRSVALDTAGAVFARRAGRRWKQVKSRWGEKAVKLELETGDGGTDAKKTAVSGFQITTAAGAVWVSADGEHWARR